MNGDSPERGSLRTKENLFPLLPCICLSQEDHGEHGSGCMCLAPERHLRHVMAGKATLSAEQREWCCQEIENVEGHSRPPADWSDADVSHEVLNAWTDYCRDKGLL